MPFQPLLWDSKYETGVEEIDLQHRYFLRLINRIADELLTLSKTDPYFVRLVDELFKYAAFHFLSEENIMLKHGYPDLDPHRKLHLQLLDKLSWRAASGSPEELLVFLTDWFVHHTQEEDRHIGDFILARESAEP